MYRAKFHVFWIARIHGDRAIRIKCTVTRIDKWKVRRSIFDGSSINVYRYSRDSFSMIPQVKSSKRAPSFRCSVFLPAALYRATAVLRLSAHLNVPLG